MNVFNRYLGWLTGVMSLFLLNHLASAALTIPTAPLKILTWNIWMMPPLTFQSPRNLQRAQAIAAELHVCNFDIVCLEKVFDDDARRLLSENLRHDYPYQYGPANSGWSFNPFKPVNGGLWVLSKFPLSTLREIEFCDCSSWECFSRKGAMLLTGSFHRHRFQLVITHLQGEEGSEPTKANDLVRERQMVQLEGILVCPNMCPHVPLFLCGDFNTQRRKDSVQSPKTSAYREMLKRFHAQNGIADRITYDDDRNRNQLAPNNTGRRAELDYILVRSNGLHLQTKWKRAILRHAGWDGNPRHSDLSYRYGVTASVFFP